MQTQEERSPTVTGPHCTLSHNQPAVDKSSVPPGDTTATHGAMDGVISKLEALVSKLENSGGSGAQVAKVGLFIMAK